MGYGDGVKGYRIWSPSERKVLLNRDVIFYESHLLHPKIEVPIPGTQSCHSPQEKDVESTTKDSEKGGHTDTEILIPGTDVVQDVTTSRFRTCRLCVTV